MAVGRSSSPVVGNEDHAAPQRTEVVFQACQAVEVQVVARLVQQGDIEAREQDCSQPEPRRLGPGQARCWAVVVLGHSEVASRSPRALARSGPPRER